MVGAARRRRGRKTKTTCCITDAQSAKNASPAETKGFDGGKQVSGIKRHLDVDSEGLPHAVLVTTADVTDRDGAIDMVKRYKRRHSRVLKFIVEGGYSGPKFERAMEELLGATVEVAKRNELHTFAVMPKRWVVERDFAWLDRCRRLWKNCERKLDTSQQMAVLAFVAILMRRL